MQHRPLDSRGQNGQAKAKSGPHHGAIPSTELVLWHNGFTATAAKRLHPAGCSQWAVLWCNPPSIELVLWNGFTTTTAYMAPNAAAHTRLTMHGE